MAEARNLPKSSMAALDDVLAMRDRREAMLEEERRVQVDNVAGDTMNKASQAMRVIDGGRS